MKCLDIRRKRHYSHLIGLVTCALLMFLVFTFQYITNTNTNDFSFSSPFEPIPLKATRGSGQTFDGISTFLKKGNKLYLNHFNKNKNRYHNNNYIANTGEKKSSKNYSIFENAPDNSLNGKIQYNDAKRATKDQEKSVDLINMPDSKFLQKSGFSGRDIFVADDESYLLGVLLKRKIRMAKPRKIENVKPTCDTKFKLANSCDDNKCLQTELPESPTMRVTQLVAPRHLQMSQEEHEILREMADQVKGNYDVILLTAASSNHFLESQALLKNLHQNVYPYLKNFTLLFYNLGLTEKERALMVKYCRCQVMDFPFHKFPIFISQLKCYSWKPILIKAHLQNGNLVFWMDASIRFHSSSSELHTLIQNTAARGIQIGRSSADSAFRTFRSMYHYFGDEPCAYLHFDQAKATSGVYHREYFVDRVILEPWVACALNENCMCPNTNTSVDCEDSKLMANKYYKGLGPIVYGSCHRFDQSAISIIIHKLYQQFYGWVMVDLKNVLTIRRKHTLVYFPDSLTPE